MCDSAIVPWGNDEIEPIKVLKRFEINYTLFLLKK